ncbi:MAG: hypothetical protein RL345_2232 [Chloroflexota bacterium]
MTVADAMGSRYSVWRRVSQGSSLAGSVGTLAPTLTEGSGLMYVMYM